MKVTNSDSMLKEIILVLPCIHNYHAPSTGLYGLLKNTIREEVENLFNSSRAQIKGFGPFGGIAFPYFKMGAIDSLDLFGIDELIIFSFYWLNRKRYKNVVDIGANIGLHSIILNKCGYKVKAFEPDPRHFDVLQKNLSLNSCVSVKAFNCAVSSKSGKMEFIRVLGNTTSSHLAGSKRNTYGKMDKFSVNVQAISELLSWADLIKIDAEGHEKEILLSTKKTDWATTDALVEVESKFNARDIFDYFKALKINLFSQKNNWQKVNHFREMPTGYKEGTLFISSKKQMPW
ncbi:MAG: FkbM family methyltransferase [Elusimicrobia bacterium]|nr:FkbM family methyltransferase [Elusimicrobiota bacterium]